MKIVMILSHGNSNVERGFSVNSECLIDNMKNETLVAQRMYNISKSLLLSYRNAQVRLTEETEKCQKEAKEMMKFVEIVWPKKRGQKI
ncbi:hypothetical protein PR048_002099 [Dryococelus australis]|uniref:Uncharacterized protein n=1 Tax=Dryococelus australis TaxID=614101 RepID=A0ABQ9IKM8_9NEOP|nr:hypothetical protein PR048_002099 [Dryococelus australis]